MGQGPEVVLRHRLPLEHRGSETAQVTAAPTNRRDPSAQGAPGEGGGEDSQAEGAGPSSCGSSEIHTPDGWLVGVAPQWGVGW